MTKLKNLTTLTKNYASVRANITEFVAKEIRGVFPPETPVELSELYFENLFKGAAGVSVTTIGVETTQRLLRHIARQIDC